MGRPTHAEQARRIRLGLGLSQQDIATKYGCSQPQISGIERGDRGREETRRYFLFLRQLEREASSAEDGEPVVFGDRLDAQFDYDTDLPGTWVALAVARTSESTELVLALDGEDRRALVGYHVIDGAIRRGKMVIIEPEYEHNVEDLLLSRLGRPEDPDGDDGLLDDDVA